MRVDGQNFKFQAADPIGTDWMVRGYFYVAGECYVVASGWGKTPQLAELCCGHNLLTMARPHPITWGPVFNEDRSGVVWRETILGRKPWIIHRLIHNGELVAAQLWLDEQGADEPAMVWRSE